MTTPILTNWCVITGGPGSGKSTVINKLASLGYTTIMEIARAYIESRVLAGENVSDILSDQKTLQQTLFFKVLQIEKHLDVEELIFFDRGLPDDWRFSAHNRCKQIRSERKSLSLWVLSRLHFSEWSRSSYASIRKPPASGLWAEPYPLPYWLSCFGFACKDSGPLHLCLIHLQYGSMVPKAWSPPS